MLNKPEKEPTGNPNPDDEFIKRHENKSGWTPKARGQFKKNVTEKVNQSNNMNHREKIALWRLKHRKDLIIKVSDKGSGICLLTPTQYNEEVMKQLHFCI